MRLIAAALFCALAMHAQELKVPDVAIPKLPSTGANAAAFAPKGWVVEAQASGDLNNDGTPDLAFVLQDTDKRNILRNSAGNLGVDEVNSNPRIVAVAFASAGGAGYRLAVQNGEMIPRWTAPTQDDNFEGTLTIVRGAVNVGLHYFANAGGWDEGETTYTFRYQHGHFELIGTDHENHSRNTGMETSTSVNYSTHMEVVHITNDEEGIDKTRRRVLRHTGVKTLDTMAVQDANP